MPVMRYTSAVSCPTERAALNIAGRPSRPPRERRVYIRVRRAEISVPRKVREFPRGSSALETCSCHGQLSYIRRRQATTWPAFGKAFDISTNARGVVRLPGHYSRCTYMQPQPHNTTCRRYRAACACDCDKQWYHIPNTSARSTRSRCTFSFPFCLSVPLRLFPGFPLLVLARREGYERCARVRAKIRGFPRSDLELRS